MRNKKEAPHPTRHPTAHEASPLPPNPETAENGFVVQAGLSCALVHAPSITIYEPSIAFRRYGCQRERARVSREYPVRAFVLRGQSSGRGRGGVSHRGDGAGIAGSDATGFLIGVGERVKRTGGGAQGKPGALRLTSRRRMAYDGGSRRGTPRRLYGRTGKGNSICGWTNI